MSQEQSSSGKVIHITVRCSLQLRTAINAYASRHGTNLTQLTLDYYRRLLEEENRQEADQI